MTTFLKFQPTISSINRLFITLAFYYLLIPSICANPNPNPNPNPYPHPIPHPNPIPEPQAQITSGSIPTASESRAVTNSASSPSSLSTSSSSISTSSQSGLPRFGQSTHLIASGSKIIALGGFAYTNSIPPVTSSVNGTNLPHIPLVPAQLSAYSLSVSQPWSASAAAPFTPLAPLVPMRAGAGSVVVDSNVLTGKRNSSGTGKEMIVCFFGVDANGVPLLPDVYRYETPIFTFVELTIDSFISLL